MKDRYSFGDNDSAAHRLALLARVFEPSSARLLVSLRPAGPPRAVDKATLDLDSRAMAQLDAINVNTWRHDPFAVSAFDAAEVSAMASALEAVGTHRPSR